MKMRQTTVKMKVRDEVKLYFNLRAKFSFYLCYGGGGRTYGSAERSTLSQVGFRSSKC